MYNPYIVVRHGRNRHVNVDPIQQRAGYLATIAVNLNYFPLEKTYLVSLPIPKQIFNDDYPAEPKTFGERLRRAGMDADLQIKELAEMLGVSENTIINWEIRGMRPWKREIRIPCAIDNLFCFRDSFDTTAQGGNFPIISYRFYISYEFMVMQYNPGLTRFFFCYRGVNWNINIVIIARAFHRSSFSVIRYWKTAEDYALCARPFAKPRLKRIMIPTTAGTGSEVTRSAVFTTSKGSKVWAWGHELLPDLVLLDPCLTVSLPADVTATTGLDAMVHAIEACTCRNRNPMADALGLHAIRLAKQHLMTAIEKPANIDARSAMLIASTLAGSAFAQTGTAAAHAIGHALATIAGIPHGRAVTIGMEVLLPRNAEASPETHAAVAEALGCAKSADQAAPAFRALIERAGVDRSLAHKDIEPETLARVMMSAENLPMLENNARPISKNDAIVLARRMLP